MTPADSSISESEHSRSNVRWKAWLLLLVVFVLGAACGIGTGGLLLKRKLEAAMSNPYAAQGPIMKRMERVESRLARELDLNAEERAALGKEFGWAAEQFKTRRTEFLDDLQEFSNMTYSRIEEALPPEKRTEFREKAGRELVPWSPRPDTPD
ncbi:MAG: hypothetical protein AAGH89_11545 [Verrucomicrobiota bacterium]